MTATSSKIIPFVVLLIIGGMLAVDMYSEFEIKEIHIALILSILPMGVGGIVKTSWESFQKVRLAQIESKKN